MIPRIVDVRCDGHRVVSGASGVSSKHTEHVVVLTLSSPPPSRPGSAASTASSDGSVVDDRLVEVRLARRYSDFFVLHTQLQAHYPQCAVPPFPVKRWWKTRGWVREERDRSFDVYLRNVLRYAWGGGGPWAGEGERRDPERAGLGLGGPRRVVDRRGSRHSTS